MLLADEFTDSISTLHPAAQVSLLVCFFAFVTLMNFGVLFFLYKMKSK